ncbi:UPF0280 family protein [Treponema sp.]
MLVLPWTLENKLYTERFYRHGLGERFESISIQEGQSDLSIAWPRGTLPSTKLIGLQEYAKTQLIELRRDIEQYASQNPLFLDSLESLKDDERAPSILRSMLQAGIAAKVGPMAAVAGAIAEALGRDIKARFDFTELIVENGGDLWIDVQEPITVAVYAGLSSLSKTFGIIFDASLCPCGLACSSGTVGPSLSYGKADAAIVIAKDAAAADAWATALGNRIKQQSDLESAPLEILAMGANPKAPCGDLAPLAALLVLADRFAAAGKIRLAPLQSLPS